MTLLEMKKKVLRLIEEINPNSELLTDDPDIANKINDVINQVQNELARIKKIAATEKMTVAKDDEKNLYEELSDFYKLKNIIGVKYDLFDNIVTFQEDGEAKIQYYKYPKLINAETPDTYKFELSRDVLEIMPYGIAADLLKSDVSAQYGRIYADAYNQALQMLDTRTSEGSIEIVGGING